MRVSQSGLSNPVFTYHVKGYARQKIAFLYQKLIYILIYLYNVAFEILSVSQILEILILKSACIFLAAITRGSSLDTGLRPPLLPLALAALRPALVLSRINSLSNCARAAKILKISSPEAVVVSMTPGPSSKQCFLFGIPIASARRQPSESGHSIRGQQ